MPHITETTTVAGDQEELFDAVADFSRLPEWDRSYVGSERVDASRPLDVGATYDCVLAVRDAQVPMVLRITGFEPPRRVQLEGVGDGFTTHEEIAVAPNIGGRVEVTYTSRLDTDDPDWVDALGQPVFSLVGKAVLRGLHDHLRPAGPPS